MIAGLAVRLRPLRGLARQTSREDGSLARNGGLSLRWRKVDGRMGGCYGLRSMPMAPAEWLAAYRTAWLQRDADAAAALFTEDATYAEQPYQDAFAGPAAVREYWARVTATQSNIEMRYGTPITVGNRTAVEWWTTLVNDGAPITLAGAFILTFDASGRCRSLREYWQFTDGTHEPKPGWGAERPGHRRVGDLSSRILQCKKPVGNPQEY